MKLINILLIFLFQELLSRTTLETHKLDMMSEISQLKLKLATSDKKSKDMDKKLNDAQVCFLNDHFLERSNKKCYIIGYAYKAYGIVAECYALSKIILWNCCILFIT